MHSSGRPADAAGPGGRRSGWPVASLAREPDEDPPAVARAARPGPAGGDRRGAGHRRRGARRRPPRGRRAPRRRRGTADGDPRGRRQGPHRRDDGEPRPRAHATPRSPTASSSSATTPTTRRAISCARCCPGIVERHGLGVTRLMLASTLAGEASRVGRHPRPPEARRDRQAAARRHDVAPAPPPVPPDDAERRREGPPPGAQAPQAGRRPRPPRAGRPRPRPPLTPESSGAPQSIPRGYSMTTALGSVGVRAGARGRATWRSWWSSQAFVVESAAEAGQAAVGADDAVARHDDRDRVAAVRRPDRPGPCRRGRAGGPARRS